jgi:hypothetical protein
VTAVGGAGPRLSRHGAAGRAEFRRVLLDSLIDSATSDLELRRSRNQRVRARSAERRLEELRRERRALESGEFSRRSWEWLGSATAGYVVTVVWLIGATLLGVHVVVDGVHTHLTVVGDIAMLALSLLWFLLAVVRVPVSEQDDDEPPDAAAPPA